MALEFENSIDALSDLSLWFKIGENRIITLADMPEIIRLRWPYFRDNWEFDKEGYELAISTYDDPDQLRVQIESFSEFIKLERNSSDTKNPFDNSDILLKFFAIFDNTPVNNINLTFEEQTIVDNKIDRVDSFTRADFLVIRDLLDKERDNIADKASSTDEDYNRVFDRSPQAARVDLGNKDVNKMFELQEAIKAVNYVLANQFSLDTATIDPFALARINADNPEIDIETYFSGSLVKLNYGEDLQALARRTLNDPDKWIDIAIANGLKAPYIDEVGEKLFLISTASGNQINIAATNGLGELNSDKLAVGQIVNLRSDIENFPEQRSITNITEIPISGELVIELDGDADLEKYKLEDNAHIRIFKLNTINSGLFILIPGTEELDDDARSIIPWFLQGSDIVERRQKVDFYLDDNSDITFNGTGDLQLAYGLENSIQAVKLKLMIESGELRRHPEYGLIPLAGSANNNIDDIQNALVESIQANIEADERFARIDRLDVGYSNTLTSTAATSLNVVLVVALADSAQLVPITFSVNI